MGKKISVEEQVREYADSIVDEQARWLDLRENGCNDPFWSDGCNMNLLRNHIIYYKGKIRECCDEHHLPIPDEYYIPLPPKVDQNYMANLRQKKRVERLRASGEKLTRKCPKYNTEQMSIL